MATKKSQKRLFSGMGYRDVQRSNSSRKHTLSKAQQIWLKDNGYRNVGWENIIQLYQKINDFLSGSDSDEPTLEELFLKADQIGSKYQTPDERAAFDQALQTEVAAISEVIDTQFSDTESEFVDFSKSSHSFMNQNTKKKRKK
ncbi:MAG: hypothetical protein KME20_04705 [Kaiparowitsia implicata GSE-PSE-MK54-09C]|jgi:hypothetical protein|nr:hypothetical protein [Kaiparowitsia implicata GSE-PSE-MK54-09C]